MLYYMVRLAAYEQMALSDTQKQHVKAWETSGLTKSAYCRQHGLNNKTFGRWCRAVRSTESNSQRLVPVQLQAEPTNERSLTLHLSQGHVLEIPNTVSSRWLGDVLRCLV